MKRGKDYFVVWVPWRLNLALDNKLTWASDTYYYLDVKVVWFLKDQSGWKGLMDQKMKKA